MLNEEDIINSNEGWFTKNNKNKFLNIFKYSSLELLVKYGRLGQVPMRPIMAIAAVAAASVLLPVLGAAAAVCCSFLALFQLLTLEFKKFCKTLALMVGGAIALPLLFALIPVLFVLEIAYAPLNFFLSLASLAIGKIDLMRKQKNLASNISPITVVEEKTGDQDQNNRLNDALTEYSKQKTWCQSRESAAVEMEFLGTKCDKSDGEKLVTAASAFFNNNKNKGKRLYTLLEPVFSPSSSPARA